MLRYAVMAEAFSLVPIPLSHTQIEDWGKAYAFVSDPMGWFPEPEKTENYEALHRWHPKSAWLCRSRPFFEVLGRPWQIQPVFWSLPEPAALLLIVCWKNWAKGQLVPRQEWGGEWKTEKQTRRGDWVIALENLIITSIFFFFLSFNHKGCLFTRTKEPKLFKKRDEPSTLYSGDTEKHHVKCLLLREKYTSEDAHYWYRAFCVPWMSMTRKSPSVGCSCFQNLWDHTPEAVESAAGIRWGGGRVRQPLQAAGPGVCEEVWGHQDLYKEDGEHRPKGRLSCWLRLAN